MTFKLNDLDVINMHLQSTQTNAKNKQNFKSAFVKKICWLFIYSYQIRPGSKFPHINTNDCALI